ncbi:hypothetical protein B488_07760 [Liberibacter crescens BT-1]|uniref:Uncharacterized protein n=1 Tax=Liberibacter crescens (strain BT-1) TaxID=1215343 RepID=L0EVR8_LIBCB|nr:hypothetical protein [Liberibacter crescens]AGA64768.1 hypothetical protein B488_07760 [Liberibacter crescens BT-1]AMC12839.1 hypothetical protein RL73_03935 [Liberibacter crescens]
MSFVRPWRLDSKNNRTNTVQTAFPVFFPAPMRGLVNSFANSPSEQGTASVLYNFWPGLKSIQIRGGCKKILSLDTSEAIVTAFPYKSGRTQKRFVATHHAIYDVSGTFPLSVKVKAVIIKTTSGHWSVFQHAMPEKNFLIAVNGCDPRLVYDGTTWTVNSPAILFPEKENMSSSRLLYGWLFKNRQWYVEAESMDAWYLPVRAIGGTARLFPLGGIMQQGGSLLAGFSWSMESGDGMSTLCGFLSTAGEIAVYAGHDPDSADGFSLKGLYHIPRPLGKNALVMCGNEVMIATAGGLMAMSQILQQGRKDIKACIPLSEPIAREWDRAVKEAPADWSLTLWAERNMLLVSFRRNSFLKETTLVMNLLNNSWSVFYNWPAQAYLVSDDNLFFGDYHGNFWMADTTGSDNGLPFTAVYLSGFQNISTPGQINRSSLAHLSLQTRIRPHIKLFACADNRISIPQFSKVNIEKTDKEVTSGLWNSSLWDSSLWDIPEIDPKPFLVRQNVHVCGRCLAVGCIVLSGGALKNNIEIGGATLMVEQGGLIA